MKTLPNEIKAFGRYKQFILCKVVPSKSKLGKMDKFPVDHKTLKIANAHNSDIWLDVKTAIILADLYGDEYFVGFVFTDDDPFLFVDIDNCINDLGMMSPLAVELIEALPGCAVEISQSRKGLHLYYQYKGEVPEHACKNIDLGIEMYHTGRFVVMTGEILQGMRVMVNSLTGKEHALPWFEGVT